MKPTRSLTKLYRYCVKIMSKITHAPGVEQPTRQGRPCIITCTTRSLIARKNKRLPNKILQLTRIKKKHYRMLPQLLRGIIRNRQKNLNTRKN